MKKNLKPDQGPASAGTPAVAPIDASVSESPTTGAGSPTPEADAPIASPDVIPDGFVQEDPASEVEPVDAEVKEVGERKTVLVFVNGAARHRISAVDLSDGRVRIRPESFIGPEMDFEDIDRAKAFVANTR